MGSFIDAYGFFMERGHKEKDDARVRVEEGTGRGWGGVLIQGGYSCRGAIDQCYS